MINSLRALVCWFLLIAPILPVCSTENDGFALTRNLQQEAKLASRTHKPILLMISREHCPYCKLMKREILYPMSLDPEVTQRIILREMLIDPGMRIIDFHGERQDSAAFAHGYGVHLTPTLLFLDPQGNELTKRIVGINTIELFSFYLDAAIEEAIAKLSN